jgi:N6-adenosine-specific RNA methylase IME4
VRSGPPVEGLSAISAVRNPCRLVGCAASQEWSMVRCDGKAWSSLIEAPIREHSRKPDEIYGLIEAYFPNVPKVELFARGEARPGWTTWGAEAE